MLGATRSLSPLGWQPEGTLHQGWDFEMHPAAPAVVQGRYAAHNHGEPI